MESGNSNDNNASTPGAAPPHPQQPTVAALPPLFEDQDDEGARFRTIPLRDDDDDTANRNSNNTDRNSNAAGAVTAPDTSNDAALAAALAEEEERLAAAEETGSTETTLGTIARTTATASLPWQHDDDHSRCGDCGEAFTAVLNRRHHCRRCGRVVCHACSDQKALVPPSEIALPPVAGSSSGAAAVSFSPDADPDRMLTYYRTTTATTTSNNSILDNSNPQQQPAPPPQQQPQSQQQLLYGRGLEERFRLAREPLRVCSGCWSQLQPVQAELRHRNAHCVRSNHVDSTDLRRLFNSPIAFSLGHEIRKASYALHNLLPQPRRRAGAVVEAYGYGSNSNTMFQSELQQCQQNCRGLSPNLGDLDGVRIPARLLERAKGVAVLTCCRGGFGLAGVEFGTGLAAARLGPGRWSAPSAIGTAGVAWGALLGAQLSDHVFLLMTDAAVAALFRDRGASVQLGADVGVAVGPVGRALEGDWNVGGGGGSNNGNNPNMDPQQQPQPPLAPIYTYSLSKGLYAGISLDGKVVTTRHDVNERFYGRRILPSEILRQPPPPAAQPLYEALQRCHVYAAAAAASGGSGSSRHPHRTDDRVVVPEPAALVNEYGEVVRGGGIGAPPAAAAAAGGGGGDPPSVANMSDITSDF